MSKVFNEWFETIDKDSQEWKEFEKKQQKYNYWYDKNIDPHLDEGKSDG